MIGEAGVTISCRSDGSQATIDLLYPKNINGYPISVEDVLTALRMHNVVNGLLEFEIEEVVHRAVESGQPQSGIVVAQCVTEKELFFYGMTGKIGPHELSARVSAARAIYHALMYPEEPFRAESAIFVEAGELIYQINMQDGENIFGKPIRELPLPVNLHKGENVSVKSGDSSILFTAEKSGYLIVDEQSKLGVREPFRTSADLLQQDFDVLPVRRDKSRALLICYHEAHAAKTVLGLEMPDLRENMQKILDLQETESRGILPLCKGIPPVIGTNGEIKYFIELQKRPEYSEDDQADYHEFSPFTFVNAGDLIAEYHHATNGIPGKDVFGNEIIPPHGSEMEISLGSNLKIEPSQTTDRISAATAGILNYSEKWIEVSESLIISGDAGPDTGNIHFEKNIIITGDVKGGYLVESGADIVIRGSIEAGARILCNGNLTVFKGVFGKESQIIVKGNADVGYIHEGRLQAGGNINVYKYVSDSCVKCRGALKVQGQGVKGIERGAVMGGEVYSLGNMILHSAGTKAMPTKLGCGFDPDLYRQLKQCRAALAAVETKILTLNRSIGIDLRSPQAAVQLKRLTPDQRKMLTQRLEELRENLIRRETLAKKQLDLDKLTFAPNMDEVSITINRHLVPKVLVVIGESIHIESSTLSNFAMRRGKHGIYISSLAKSTKNEKMV